jgi:micrococcal nuclease
MADGTHARPRVNGRWAAALLVLASALGACGGGPSGPTDRGSVISITDGDTLRIRVAEVEERVRLIGIDTPEVYGRGGLRECFGKEASARLAELLPVGEEVRLEIDAEPRDRYDRLLAYVYRASDDLHINLEMARTGYAAPLTVPPNVAFADRFVAAAADARGEGLGLWSACGGPDKEI